MHWFFTKKVVFLLSRVIIKNLKELNYQLVHRAKQMRTQIETQVMFLRKRKEYHARMRIWNGCLIWRTAMSRFSFLRFRFAFALQIFTRERIPNTSRAQSQETARKSSIAPFLAFVLTLWKFTCSLQCVYVRVMLVHVFVRLRSHLRYVLTHAFVCLRKRLLW